MSQASESNFCSWHTEKKLRGKKGGFQQQDLLRKISVAFLKGSLILISLLEFFKSFNQNVDQDDPVDASVLPKSLLTGS